MAIVNVGPATGYRGSTVYDLTQEPNFGYVPATHVIRDLRRAEAALEPRATPLITSIGYGDPVSQFKHEWARKSERAVKASLAATLNIGTATGNMQVTSTEAKIFAKYMVLQIESEIFWVYDTPTVVGADGFVPVVGAQGGTAAASHASGTNNIFIIGSAMPYLEDYALNPFTWGEQYYNYPMRFSGAVKTDRALNQTSNYEVMGTQHDPRVAAELRQQKFNLEAGIYRLRRQLGTLAAGNAIRPSLMGGMREFVANLYDQSAALLTIYALETAMLDLNALVGENAPTQLIMNMNTWAILSRLLNPRRRWTNDTTEANLVWKSVTFVTGTYRFMATTPTQCPDGQIWLVNTRDMSLKHYRSMGWHERELPDSGEAMYTGVGCDITFEASAPKAMGLIYNFGTTLASYPTL